MSEKKGKRKRTIERESVGAKERERGRNSRI